MDRQFFWVKKIEVKKISGKKKFGRKFFGVKKIWVRIFVGEKNWGWKFFRGKKIGQKLQAENQLPGCSGSGIKVFWVVVGGLEYP